MSVEFKVAKESRSQVRRSVTIDLKQASLYATISDANLKPAALYQAKLEQYRADLASLDKIVAEGLVTDDAALTSDIERARAYQGDLNASINELAYSISEYRTQQQIATFSTHNPASPTPIIVDPQPRGARHKLLEVDVIKFKGDPAQWDEFWDDFVATVDKKPHYTAQEKLKILKGSLEGEPRGMVQNLQLTEANYEQAKEALEERYANKQMRRFAHFEALLAIPPADHQISKLRAMCDQCEAHIRSLVALGMDEDKFGEVFVPIMLSKLPKFVRMEIGRKNGKVDWTLANLRSLLKAEIDIRDTCERTSWHEQEKPAKKYSNTKTKQAGNKSPATASALVVSGGAKGKAKSKQQCVFCLKSHESHLCRTFPDSVSRRRQVTPACFSCLGSGHRAAFCPFRVPCRFCNVKGHHMSLCDEKFAPKNDEKSDQPSEESVQVVDCQNSQVGDHSSANALGIVASGKRAGRAILETAVATVKGTRTSCKARLIFDSASTLSFMTTTMANQIGAKLVGEEVSSVGRFRDRKRSTMTYRLYTVDLVLPGGSCKRIVVNGVDVISTPVQIVPLAAAHHSILSSVALAEPLVDFPRTVEIDILIGLDWYHTFLEDAQLRLTDELVMKKSVFGWIASGFQCGGAGQRSDHAHVILAAEGRNVEAFDVERFWALDEIGIRDDPGSVDDEVALKFFNDTIKLEDGRYQVKWPFKEAKPNLPENKVVALRRLKSLWSKLKDQPQTLATYDQIIQDQLTKQIIEVAPDVPDGLVHYLPHHVVVKETSATTKLRIVYDASAKKNRHSASLNDCLYRGPVLMSDLCGILIRARLHPIGILSDVEKAYLQVGLQIEDRDVTRFFWLKDVSKGFHDDNLVCFRFRRVLFGVRPSAFMLAGTLAFHIRKSDKPVARELEGNIYVDNAFVGKSDVASALEFYHESKQLLSDASMNLREWFSNSDEFMTSIPESDRGKGNVTQLLGVKWHLAADELSSQPKLKDVQQPVTKRLVLKAIAAVYDPCGWFCPVVMPGKILMQDLWLQKSDWDDPISNELRAQWDEVWSNLNKISGFRIPRCVDERATSADSVVELHTFCDASARAYGAATYIRVQNSAGNTVNLLFAKARVSPARKELSIPRLELVGMIAGVRIQQFVAKELDLPVARQVIWTDSKCLLHWIHSKTVQTTFVENRLREIRRSLDCMEFRYVPTSDNPADIPSRGSDVESLRSNGLWWNGPSWLLESDDNWPANVELSEKVGVDEPPVVVEETVAATVAVVPDCAIEISRFSNLSRLLRVTAWVLRGVGRFKGKSFPESNLTACEIKEAELFWVRQVQRDQFGGSIDGELSQELRNLKSQLGLHLDPDGVMRCQSRLDHSYLSIDQKNPIFLPAEHPFTKLVVRRAHARVMHSGTTSTLAEVRTRYWIPHGRVLVKRAIRNCSVCRRFDGGPFRIPDPPALPPERVVESPPFSVVGVDYAGPLFVQTAEGPVKVWIALFTCAVVRAVHIEVAEGLSASDFLLCFRRFVAARGAPQIVISDNAKQFRLASQLLKKPHARTALGDVVQDYSAEFGIEWKFVPEMAPWMGGFYERLVRPIKEAIKKTLGSRLVSLKELNTLMPEIAAMINSRPLTYLETDVGDQPLRPLDFLRVPPKPLPGPSRCSDLSLGRRLTAHELVEQFGECEKQLNRCWQQWRSTYLVSLRQQYWKHGNRKSSDMAPKVGTVVLVKDALPRLKWRIGRIISLRMSRDGVCRSVELRLGNGNVIVRPIKLLYPLEYSVDEEHAKDATKISTNRALQKHIHAAKARVQPLDEEQGYSSDEGSVEF